MILPTKHVTARRSVLGVGAQILFFLSDDQTVTRLWGSVRSGEDGTTFRQFVLALDLLYLLGCVELSDGILRRRRSL